MWAFPAAGSGSLSSDQAILDALTTNNIYVNVHTMNYPSGEVRGDFTLTQGSIAFTAPTDPGPAPTYTGTALDRDVERFVAQATFGATDALITEVKTKGFTTWITEQMNTALNPQSMLKPYVMTSDDWLVTRSIAAGVADDKTPVFQNFSYSNITVINAAQVAKIVGLPEKAIDQLGTSVKISLQKPHAHVLIKNVMS